MIFINLQQTKTKPKLFRKTKEFFKKSFYKVWNSNQNITRLFLHTFLCIQNYGKFLSKNHFRSNGYYPDTVFVIR